MSAWIWIIMPQDRVMQDGFLSEVYLSFMLVILRDDSAGYSAPIIGPCGHNYCNIKCICNITKELFLLRQNVLTRHMTPKSHERGLPWQLFFNIWLLKYKNFYFSPFFFCFFFCSNSQVDYGFPTRIR